MRSANEELAAFRRLRGQLAGELALCVVVGGALYAVAARMPPAIPEAEAVFLGTVALFGFALVRLVLRLVPVLRFRCPRCSQRFHAAVWAHHPRAIVSLRSCAHCGFALSRSRDAAV